MNRISALIKEALEQTCSSYHILLLFSCQVMFNSLWPHELQHVRLPCPLLTPRVCLNSCSLIQWCYLTISFSAVLFSFCLQSFLTTGSFSSELAFHIRWPKYWSFSLSISPSNEYSGLISFRTDWLDLLAVQGTLKSLLQHPNSKASILWCSAFFMVQLSHLFMTTGENIGLTRWTFVGEVMFLLFKMLSRFVTALLPKNKHPDPLTSRSWNIQLTELQEINSYSL